MAADKGKAVTGVQNSPSAPRLHAHVYAIASRDGRDHDVELLRELLADFDEIGSPGFAVVAQQRLDKLAVE